MTLTEAMDEATIRLGISKEQSIEAQNHATESIGLVPNFVIKEGHEEAVLEALSVWLKDAIEGEDNMETVATLNFHRIERTNINNSVIRERNKGKRMQKQSKEIKEMLVTPQQASEWLERHYDRVAKGEFVQRRISDMTINRYAADMRIGAWLLLPDPITFDENENLQNGQHRLEAVRRSGRSVVMMVAFGWPAKQGAGNTIDGFDRGKLRSVAAQLGMSGMAQANVVAGAMSSICRCYFGGNSTGMSLGQCKYMLETLDLHKHVEKLISIVGRGGTGRYIGPLAYYRTVKPNKADDFAEAVATMNFEKNTAPQIFSRFTRDSLRQADRDRYLRVLCMAIQHWDNNATIAFIRGSSDACYWLIGLNPKLRTALSNALLSKAQQQK